MPDEKKPDSPGPVVIRKGHVRPPPAGARIEAPVEEQIETPRKPADPRPLWQRVAQEKAGAAGAPGPKPQGLAGPRPPRPRARPARPPRSEGGPERKPRGDPAVKASSPRLIEPPPAPEAPIPNEGSFADLLASSEAAPRRRFEVGEKVAGKIIQLGHDVAFLELGSGVAEGMIEIAELKDAEGNVTARVGDIVDGVVVKGGERGVVVSRGLSRGHRDREALIEASRTRLPVEGLVKAANKGGLEVEVMGQRAFCPMSQIDIRFVGDPATYVGQKLQFKVQRADARDVVLSRRALLEEERAERAQRTREKLAEGAVFEGIVTSVQEYGAFVDIGGVEGLVHVSELSWDRGTKPTELLHSGDKLQVQVLRVEQDAKKGERISLSVKALSPPPAAEPVPATAASPKPPPARPQPPRVGDLVAGAVDRVEPYGVFVRFPGGRGLVPASETGTPRGADLRKAFKPGDPLSCVVTAIDEQGRIRLSKTEAEAAEERKEAEAYLSRAAPPAGAKGFGTLGDLLREKLKKQ